VAPNQQASEYAFLCGKRDECNELRSDFFFSHNRIFVRKGFISAIKIVEFISDSMPHIAPRRSWCAIILNVHITTEDNIYNMKVSLY
jgi:hypothetical protein